MDREVSCDAQRGTYVAPKLTVFGAVAELTAGGGSGCAENGNCSPDRNKRKPR